MALTTVSYRELTDKETNPISKIYDMYVQGLVRLLKMFSFFLLFYSLGVITIRVVEVFDAKFPGESETQIVWIVWISSVLLNFTGVLVGLIGIRAVRIQSKGSSLTFFSFIVLYDVVYLVIQAFFLYYTIEIDTGKYLKNILGDVYSVKFSVYYLFVTFFILIFMTVKAFRFHSLLTTLIAKRQFSSKETVGLTQINE